MQYFLSKWFLPTIPLLYTVRWRDLLKYRKDFFPESQQKKWRHAAYTNQTCWQRWTEKGIIRICQRKIAFTVLSVIFIVINNIPPGSLRSSWCQIEFANNISRRIGCKREKLVSCTVENKGYRLIWIIEYRIWIVCVDRICIIHYYFNNFKSFLPFRFVKSKSERIHRKI